ncbi:oligosaccharide flippase family protein [Neobacillus cucumis]|uniref:oligosaccharide flippase family protein n=1 Tax=Neobacillus cucumis TaxID=1740721 RepID=UPI00203EABE8|nr:oligosaccharide flippase family protein [Neobacillus cucumis]MCM3729097.1 oligosaccharide flippase family protein [Neobacillus cucumis]
MNIFIKKLVGFSVGPVAGAFIGLITIPLTTYFIVPSEYGKASMFALFQMIFATLIYLGIDQSYTREYHSEKNKKNLFQNAIIIPLVFSLFILLLTILFSKHTSILLFDSPNYKFSSILFGLMIVFMVLERFILLSIRMEEKALEYSLLNIFVKLAVLVLTLFFIIFVRRDFLTIVYATTIGQVIGDLYLLFRYRKLFILKDFKLDTVLLKRMLSFGLPILISASLSNLLNSLDRLSLRAWSDFYQLGIFTATLRIVATLTIIQTSFTSFWVPTAYRWHEKGKSMDHYKIVSEGLLLVLSVLFFGILTFKGLIVTLLSSNYEDAKFVVGFLCLQPIMYTISETTCLGIVFSRKSYLNIWIGIISIIPNIILNIVLVPHFGAIGAAIATGISYICFFVGRTYFSGKCGMKFNVNRHYLVIFLLLIAAFINLIHSEIVVLLNIVMLILVVAVQFGTIKKFINIRKGNHKELYDFS